MSLIQLFRMNSSTNCLCRFIQLRWKYDFVRSKNRPISTTTLKKITKLDASISSGRPLLRYHQKMFFQTELFRSVAAKALYFFCQHIFLRHFAATLPPSAGKPISTRKASRNSQPRLGGRGEGFGNNCQRNVLTINCYGAESLHRRSVAVIGVARNMVHVSGDVIYDGNHVSSGFLPDQTARNVQRDGGHRRAHRDTQHCHAGTLGDHVHRVHRRGLPMKREKNKVSANKNNRQQKLITIEPFENDLRRYKAFLKRV